MRQVEIAGTRKELGTAYGEIVVERQLNTWWQTPSPTQLTFAKACEEAIVEHAPGYVEELRALAEATNTDYDVVLFNMTVVYLAEQPTCNCVAISGKQTASGKTLYIRNHDWIDADIEHVTCFRTAPKNGYRSLAFGFSDPGRYDGINEEGLAIGGSSIPFYLGKQRAGFRMNVITRWILDTCPDVMSAVAFMRSVPHMEACAYLLADQSGLIARVEVAPEGVDVALTDDDMLATVNMFQSQKLSSHDRVPGEDNCIFAYQKRIDIWFKANQGNIALEKAMAFARDHDAGLCDHGQHMNVPGGTIYSWVGELGTNELHLSHGRPCQTHAQRVPLHRRVS